MKTLVLLLACLNLAVALECGDAEIACKDEEKCIPIRYICDNDNDCTDASDEANDLCEAWRNDDCERNNAKCMSSSGASTCIEIAAYCTPERECQGTLDRRLCVMLEGGILGPLSDFTVPKGVGSLNESFGLRDKFNDLYGSTLSDDRCPPMYTLLGDQCISFFYVGSMSWGEATAFCKVLKGELMTFRNISQYTAVVQHLQKNAITSSFWIGGTIQNASVGWTWTDGSPMELGTPYWASRYSTKCVERNVTVAEEDEPCYRYIQAPDPEPFGECVSLSFEHYYQMIDENCLKRFAPLCVCDEVISQGPLKN